MNEHCDIAGIFKGNLCYMILRALQKKPLHGYAIIKRIELITGDIWKPTTGSVYPLLAQMHSEGLVSIKETEHKGRKRKVYAITKKGIVELEKRKKIVAEMVKTAGEMFQHLFPKAAGNPDELFELLEESRFLQKELIAMKANMLQFLVLSKQGKISTNEKALIKIKLAELNAMLKKIIESKNQPLG
jgi:DNA-binding PadR family transcriptional regulator